MKIYKMTATFGKLEHAELTLQPGLNILTAPNEWGKSTWCAFLVAMLYGLDTRAKTTKTTLADKERYAPWSGNPMAGRIDLNWNGRDITIERRTKGRVPLGEFKAYETDSGLPVPELTAANCGQQLLGVEQTVFRRAGFIRQSDLPVTQDEALRRRLNDLVTTGDESGTSDKLAKNLRDLKNRCRFNKSGLLPQLESQRDALQDKVEELDALDAQVKKLKMRLDDVKTWLQQLNTHQAALDYAAAEADAGRVAQAREALEKQLGREPTVDEIAQKTGLSRREVSAALESVVEPLSLEEPVYADGGDAVYVIDQVRDPDGEDSWISGLQFRQTVAGLTPREKRIMELRYLKGKTQMEVAQEIGISQAQVSRLEKGALDTIKKNI